MDFAIGALNFFFKKPEFKTELEKLLGPNKNFEKVLNDVLEVFSEHGFFEKDDWQDVILDSIKSVISQSPPDLNERPGTDDNISDDVNLQVGDHIDTAVAERSRRCKKSNLRPAAIRRSSRIRLRTQRYSVNTSERASRQSSRF